MRHLEGVPGRAVSGVRLRPSLPSVAPPRVPEQGTSSGLAIRLAVVSRGSRFERLHLSLFSSVFALF